MFAFLTFLTSPLLTLATGGYGLVSSLFTNPIARYFGFALMVLAVVGGAYTKGRLDEHTSLVAQYNKEAADAVAQADAARADADKKFIAGKFRNSPSKLPGSLRPRHSDGFSRD